MRDNGFKGLKAVEAVTLPRCHDGIMDDDLMEIFFGKDDVTPKGMAMAQDQSAKEIKGRTLKRIDQ